MEGYHFSHERVVAWNVKEDTVYNEAQVIQVVEGNTRPIINIDIVLPDPDYPNDRDKDTVVDLAPATRHVFMKYRLRSDQTQNTNSTLWTVELTKHPTIQGRAYFTPTSSATSPWLPAGITVDIPEFEAEFMYQDTAISQDERLVKLLVFSVRRKFS